MVKFGKFFALVTGSLFGYNLGFQAEICRQILPNVSDRMGTNHRFAFALSVDDIGPQSAVCLNVGPLLVSFLIPKSEKAIEAYYAKRANRLRDMLAMMGLTVDPAELEQVEAPQLTQGPDPSAN